MSYTSPLSSPDSYISRISSLSSEAIAIDKGVDRATRDATEFETKYISDFGLVTDLKTSTHLFSSRWVNVLQQTRDAASSISGWYQRFDQVFLDMINDIASDGDAKDVADEFRAWINEPYPSTTYNLNDVPGLKKSFNDIERLVTAESQNVIQILEGNKWKAAVGKLNQDLPAIKNGIQRMRGALNQYATKLE
ncbi:hypothetical protein DFP72DRAFT_917940 [Ephemerocybe angulata]|uniref:Uncharacterized protein n=1 Tax=Ephemerocybe angulata TaxID=980116 RepID=A0A8H6HJ82_9AGAR|nr:hypothetical protein DFP72DRAFT_917940 [Tulosesus angulatus]